MSGLIGLAIGAAVIGTVLHCAVCGLATHDTRDHHRYAGADKTEHRPVKRRGRPHPSIMDEWGGW